MALVIADFLTTREVVVPIAIAGVAVVAHKLGMSPIAGLRGLIQEFQKLIALVPEQQSLNAMIFLIMASLTAIYFFSSSLAILINSIISQDVSEGPTFIEFLVSFFSLSLFGGMCVRMTSK